MPIKIDIRASLRREKNMVKVSIIGKMGINIKGSGRMGRNRVWGGWL